MPPSACDEALAPKDLISGGQCWRAHFHEHVLVYVDTVEVQPDAIMTTRASGARAEICDKQVNSYDHKRMAILQGELAS